MTRVPRRWALCAAAGRALCSTAASRPPAPRTMTPRRSRAGSAVAASSEPVLAVSAFLTVIGSPRWWSRTGLIAQLPRDGQCGRVLADLLRAHTNKNQALVLFRTASVSLAHAHERADARG